MLELTHVSHVMCYYIVVGVIILSARSAVMSSTSKGDRNEGVSAF